MPINYLLFYFDDWEKINIEDQIKANNFTGSSAADCIKDMSVTLEKCSHWHAALAGTFEIKAKVRISTLTVSVFYLL